MGQIPGKRARDILRAAIIGGTVGYYFARRAGVVPKGGRAVFRRDGP